MNNTFNFNGESFSLDTFTLTYSTKSKVIFNFFLLFILGAIISLIFGYLKESALILFVSIIFLFFFMQNIVNTHVQYELSLMKFPKELLKQVVDVFKNNDDEWNATIIQNMIEKKKGA